MYRSLITGILAGLIAFPCVTQAAGQKLCKPTLAFKDIHFSKVEPSTQERKWTATVSVDASRCATNSSGYFEVGFLREKENALELEFREQFIWLTPSVKVGVDFWADEAAEHFWFDNITPCACAGERTTSAAR